VLPEFVMVVVGRLRSLLNVSEKLVLPKASLRD
jgi:hypothetical protein